MYVVHMNVSMPHHVLRLTKVVLLGCHHLGLNVNWCLISYYAVVTPLRKAASYEPRIAILGIWGDTWLTRGKYGIYVAVRGSCGGLRDAFCHVKSALSTAVSPTWR